jgi:hypothetical protein
LAPDDGGGPVGWLGAALTGTGGRDTVVAIGLAAHAIVGHTWGLHDHRGWNGAGATAVHPPSILASKEKPMQPVRFLPAIAAALLATADPAQAQQTGTVLHEAGDDVMVPPFNKQAENLEGTDIVTPGGDEIGEVKHVLVDASGQPVAVAAEVGGFLGIGQKMVVISLNRLQLKDDDLVTPLSKEELQGLQAWGEQ